MMSNKPIIDSGIMTVYGAWRVLDAGDRGYHFSYITEPITKITRLGDRFYLSLPGFRAPGLQVKRDTLLDYVCYAAPTPTDAATDAERDGGAA